MSESRMHCESVRRTLWRALRIVLSLGLLGVSAWFVTDTLQVAVAGQNLCDDSHPEFGNSTGIVGIPRSVYLKLVWGR